MAELKCFDCGCVIGETVDGEVRKALCKGCFDQQAHKIEIEKRMAEAEAKPLTDNELIETVEGWWWAVASEYNTSIEDDVLHEKVMIRLGKLLGFI